MQKEHFMKAKQMGAEVYIASVAKPEMGIKKAYIHFEKLSKEFKTPILLSNSIGFSDNFMSVGHSAIWNANGKRIEQLNEKDPGIIIYDSENQCTAKENLKIEKAQLSDLKALYNLYSSAKEELHNKGISQWNEHYPTSQIIEQDVTRELLFAFKNNDEIIGAINLSEEQETQYQNINWQYDETKVLVIHRLAIDPKFQGKGYARVLMDFAEEYAMENRYTSIRLDAYSQNELVIQWYQNRNYVIRGTIYFPERDYPFYAMEKEIFSAY